MSHPQPPQGYAVELYFDPALENQVLKSWNVLARRQITTHLIEIESRPHITLLSSPTLDPLRLQPLLKTLAARLDPLLVSLSSLAADTNSGSLSLVPTPTLALLHLHAQLCEVLRKDGVDVPEEFKQDAWVPSCPVAIDVPKGRLAEALSVVRDLKLPVSGYAVDVGVVELSPVREVFSFPLGASSEA